MMGRWDRVRIDLHAEDESPAAVAREDQSRAEALEKLRAAACYVVIAVDPESNDIYATACYARNADADGNTVRGEDSDRLAAMSRAAAESAILCWLSLTDEAEELLTLVSAFAMSAAELWDKVTREGGIR